MNNNCSDVCNGGVCDPCPIKIPSVENYVTLSEKCHCIECSCYEDICQGIDWEQCENNLRIETKNKEIEKMKKLGYHYDSMGLVYDGRGA